MVKKQRGKYYRIVVKGHLESHWSQWFDGMTVKKLPGGDTALSGYVVDQSALHGLLMKIRDLGLPLISVHSLGEEEGKE